MKSILEKVQAILESIPEWEKRWLQKSIDISFQIQDFLDKKGWTQKELAERTGQRPSFISRIMAGQTNMTLQTIAKIETALGEDLMVIPKYALESRTMQQYHIEFQFDLEEHPIRVQTMSPPQRVMPIHLVREPTPYKTVHAQTGAPLPSVQEPFSTHLLMPNCQWIA